MAPHMISLTVPFFQWRTISVLNPLNDSQVISVGLVTKNVWMVNPVQGTNLHSPNQLLVSELVTPVSLVEGPPSSQTIVLEIRVRDRRFGPAKLQYHIQKDFLDTFIRPDYDPGMGRLGRFVRFKCYMRGCPVTNKNMLEIGRHFFTEHFGAIFDVRRVVEYVIGQPGDPLLPPANLAANPSRVVAPPVVHGAERLPRAQFTGPGQRAFPVGGGRSDRSMRASAPSPAIRERRYALGSNLGPVRSASALSRSLTTEAPQHIDKRTPAVQPDSTGTVLYTPSSLEPSFGRFDVRTKIGHPHIQSHANRNLGLQGELLPCAHVPISTANSSAAHGGVATRKPACGGEPNRHAADQAQWPIEFGLLADPVERFCICNVSAADAEEESDEEGQEKWIGCSNDVNCIQQWFHLQCVGLQGLPPGDWFCTECTVKQIGKARTRGPGQYDEQEPPQRIRRTRTAAEASGKEKRMQSSATPVRVPPLQLILPPLPKSGLSMSNPSPIDMKPWSADLDKQFVSHPDNVGHFNLATLDEVKQALRSNPIEPKIITSASHSPLPESEQIQSGRRRVATCESESENKEPASQPVSASHDATPKGSWQVWEENVMIDVIKKCVDSGLNGEPLWLAAYPLIKQAGVNRALGGMKMRWCRGLREKANIDERRRKNAKSLRTSTQPKRRTDEHGLASTDPSNLSSEQDPAPEKVANAKDDSDDDENSAPAGKDTDSDFSASSDSAATPPTKRRKILTAMPRGRKPTTRSTPTALRTGPPHAEGIDDDDELQEAILLSLASAPPVHACAQRPRARSLDLTDVTEKRLRYF